MQKKITALLISLILIVSCGEQKGKSPERFNPENIPAGMSYIPSGSFNMGGRSDQAYFDEFPKHEVKISAFFMDKTEVTNKEFLEFTEATGYITTAEKDVDWEILSQQLPEGTPRPADSLLRAGSLVFKQTNAPVSLNDYTQWWEWTVGANWRHPFGPESSIEDRMDFPVVHVSWDDAKAYAEWAGKRLPTEAEWEWAALGGDKSNKYPWGNEPAEKAVDKANFWQGLFPYQNLELDGYAEASPVKSFPPNGYGLYDMAGNVWEWCQDKYNVETYKKYSESGEVEDPQGIDSYYDPRDPYSPKHVIRGGSFLCNDSYCSGYRVARRMSSSKDSGLSHTGFRCVKDLNKIK